MRWIWWQVEYSDLNPIWCFRITYINVNLHLLMINVFLGYHKKYKKHAKRSNSLTNWKLALTDLTIDNNCSLCLLGYVKSIIWYNEPD